MTENKQILAPMDFDKLYQADVARRKAVQRWLDDGLLIEERSKELRQRLETLLKLADEI